MMRRFLAMVGLACLVPIGHGLLSGSLTIVAAAQRGLTLLAILWVLEHLVVPVVMLLAFPALASAERPTPAGDVAIAPKD